MASVMAFFILYSTKNKQVVYMLKKPKRNFHLMKVKGQRAKVRRRNPKKK